MLAAFVLVVMLSGYVSLATLAAAATAIVWVAVTQPHNLFMATGIFVMAMAALVVWKHPDNIVSPAPGTDHRLQKARVIGRRPRPEQPRVGQGGDHTCKAPR